MNIVELAMVETVINCKPGRIEEAVALAWIFIDGVLADGHRLRREQLLSKYVLHDYDYSSSEVLPGIDAKNISD